MSIPLVAASLIALDDMPILDDAIITASTSGGIATLSTPSLPFLTMYSPPFLATILELGYAIKYIFIFCTPRSRGMPEDIDQVVVEVLLGVQESWQPYP
jgi:hypothetical protein